MKMRLMRNSHNKNINDRQQSWLDAQKAARPLYWHYTNAQGGKL
jgi:hypothetical protein